MEEGTAIFATRSLHDNHWHQINQSSNQSTPALLCTMNLKAEQCIALTRVLRGVKQPILKHFSCPENTGHQIYNTCDSYGYGTVTTESSKFMHSLTINLEQPFGYQCFES